MQDIVFPDRNEAAFIARAKAFGYSRLVFVYDEPSRFHRGDASVKVLNALLAHPSKVESARSKTPFVLIRSSDKDLHSVEQSPPTVLFDLEQSPRYDALHQRAAGLNHILARACAKNGVSIGFSLYSLLEAKPERRAVLMGRMAQNISLCRKYKVPMTVASFARSPGGMRNPADIAALFTVLGMHPSEAKKSLG